MTKQRVPPPRGIVAATLAREGPPRQAFNLTKSNYEAWAADWGVSGGPFDDDSGNGVSNLAALAFGSNPLLASSRPQLPEISLDRDQVTIRFKFLAKVNLPIQYELVKANDLASGHWEPVDAPITIPRDYVYGEYVDGEISVPLEEDNTFYRLHIRQQ